MIYNLSKKLNSLSAYILMVSCVFLSFILGFSSVYAYELNLQNKLVTDQANILSLSEEAELEKMLLDIEKEHKAQISIVTLDSLKWEEAATVAYDIADSNGIWKDGIDSGWLILIAPNERKRRIETWYGLEWPIPDIIANRLGENVLVPAFRNWDYSWWLMQVVMMMSDLLAGEFEWFEEEEDIAVVDSELFSSFFVWWAMLMFFFGSIYRSIQKDSSKRAKWIFYGASWLWLLAVIVLWWTAVVLILVYLFAGLFGGFVDQSGRRWSRWFGWWWFGGFWRWWSSFGWWWFWWFGWWSFGGGWAGGSW